MRNCKHPTPRYRSGFGVRVPRNHVNVPANHVNVRPGHVNVRLDHVNARGKSDEVLGDHVSAPPEHDQGGRRPINAGSDGASVALSSFSEAPAQVSALPTLVSHRPRASATRPGPSVRSRRSALRGGPGSARSPPPAGWEGPRLQRHQERRPARNGSAPHRRGDGAPRPPGPGSRSRAQACARGPPARVVDVEPLKHRGHIIRRADARRPPRVSSPAGLPPSPSPSRSASRWPSSCPRRPARARSRPRDPAARAACRRC